MPGPVCRHSGFISLRCGPVSLSLFQCPLDGPASLSLVTVVPGAQENLLLYPVAQRRKWFPAVATLRVSSSSPIGFSALPLPREQLCVTFPLSQNLKVVPLLLAQVLIGSRLRYPAVKTVRSESGIVWGVLGRPTLVLARKADKAWVSEDGEWKGHRLVTISRGHSFSNRGTEYIYKANLMGELNEMF